MWTKSTGEYDQKTVFFLSICRVHRRQCVCMNIRPIHSNTWLYPNIFFFFDAGGSVGVSKLPVMLGSGYANILYPDHDPIYL